MKRIVAAVLALAALLPVSPAFAYRHSHGYHHGYSHHAYSHHGYHDTPGYYRNVDGLMIHRPMHSNHRLAGSTATCRDGSQSFSRHHRGTCSHHGGVLAFR